MRRRTSLSKKRPRPSRGRTQDASAGGARPVRAHASPPRGDACDIGRVDVKDQQDGQHRFDRAGDVHPGCRRIELRSLEEVQRRRLGELADHVRDEEQRADEAQDHDSVQQIEFVSPGHASPRCGLFVSFQWIAGERARWHLSRMRCSAERLRSGAPVIRDPGCLSTARIHQPMFLMLAPCSQLAPSA